MSDDLHLGTRDKVTLRMTRDGAVEDNLSRKTSERISERAADADFSKEAEAAGEVSADRSRTKTQQRRYHQKMEGEEPAQELQREFDSQAAISVPEETIEEPEVTSEGTLQEHSVRTQPRKADAPAEAKKKQRKRIYEEQKKKKPTRLQFDDEPGLSASEGVKAESETVVIGSSGKIKAAAAGAVHSKVDEDSDDNSAVEAAHRTEEAAENAGGRLKETVKSHVSDRKSKEKLSLDQAERGEKVSKLKFDEAEGTQKGSGGRMSQNKIQQKRRYKKEYAEARKAGKPIGAAGSSAGKTAATKGAQTFGDKLKNGAKQLANKSKGWVAMLLIGGMGIMMAVNGIGAMGSMITGGGNAVLESSYLASDNEIYAAEAFYADKEAALQRQIDTIETSYPGYDEYRFQVDEISHNPYHLTSFLTVRYGNFTSTSVQSELDAMFQDQYHISVESTTETVTETRTVRVGESLGNVVTSGYCSCSICCGQWSGGPTASGVYPTANHTIAVDASNPTVPMGTKVVMNGVEYTVEDTGAFDRYGVDFDVYYDSHSAASAHGHQTWEAFLADSNGSQTVTVTDTRTIRVLNVTVTNAGFDTVAGNRMNDPQAIGWYALLNSSFGNRDYLWDTTAYQGYAPGGMSYEIPPEALQDEQFRKMITEAERYLGYPYVWGGSSPSTSFDCSGFVSWVINNCGNGWSVGRLGADGLRGICTYVAPSQAKPGDLIFFQGTYDTTGASHVGIYVGNGMMIHCGNPIQYTSIQTNYWQQHFLCFGRLS